MARCVVVVSVSHSCSGLSQPARGFSVTDSPETYPIKKNPCQATATVRARAETHMPSRTNKLDSGILANHLSATTERVCPSPMARRVAPPSPASSRRSRSLPRPAVTTRLAAPTASPRCSTNPRLTRSPKVPPTRSTCRPSSRLAPSPRRISPLVAR
jgi:hypothetical protein